jgi:hypothetical protein
VTSCEYGDGGIGNKEKRGEEHRGEWKRKSKRTGIIGMIDIADAIIPSAIASHKAAGRYIIATRTQSTFSEADLYQVSVLSCEYSIYFLNGPLWTCEVVKKKH